MRRFFVVSVAVLGLGLTGTAWAADAGAASNRQTVPANQQAIVRYERALDRACESGVAPGQAVYHLYQSARKAQPGLTDPEAAYLQCTQAP
jgi:hypothetical protein